MISDEFDPPNLDPQATPGDAGSKRRQSADELREQAAAARRLSHKARTPAGAKALDGLGDHLDERARKLDPSSQRL